MVKTCFVVAPIGEDGTEIRMRSDDILEYVVGPALQGYGYGEPVRADQISEPGVINDQIIEHLLNDDLVIADLTGHNPNVFYELAVRHAAGKAVIQFIDIGETIPFDVAGVRTVRVDHRSPRSADESAKKVAEQIKAVESSEAESPLSRTLDLLVLRSRDNPDEQRDAKILSELHELRTEIYAQFSAINSIIATGPTGISSLDTSALNRLSRGIVNLKSFLESIGTNVRVSSEMILYLYTELEKLARAFYHLTSDEYFRVISDDMATTIDKMKSSDGN